MKEKTIFKYIKKLIPLIVVVCALLSFVVSISFTNQRTFSASAVINYNYDEAESGKTPAGTELDVNEIKSSVIMSKVIDSLGLNGVYSVDNLTSRITITACPDADKEAQKEALLKEGEEYVYEPTTYIVAFVASNSEGQGFARTMLDEILDTYFSVFSGNYINVDHFSNQIDKIYEDNYDYLEMVEYIDNCIDNTVNQLYQRSAAQPYYRSTETKMSFDDLVDEFNYLRSVKINDLYTQIHQYQVTKNKSILIAHYNERIDENTIASGIEDQMLSDINEIIDAYVQKMEESGNTNITSEYILSDLYDRLISGISSDQTVTYDKLIYAWRDHGLNDQLALIDSAYCRYVLDDFTTCTGLCHDHECETSPLTCSALVEANYAEIEQEVSEKIQELTDDLTVLYSMTRKTNEEYNKFLGCKNISVLSTVSTQASIDVKIYTIIAFAFLMVVCCGGLILIGRLNDIVMASFYTDPITKFRNRAYFDKYLKRVGNYNLDDGTAIVSLTLTNQREVNEQYGRETGDSLINLVAEELRSAFARMDAQFIYNGNSHYIIMLNKTDAITAEDALNVFHISMEDRERCDNVRITYKAGIAETFRDGPRSARALLVKAVNNCKESVLEAKKQ